MIYHELLYSRSLSKDYRWMIIPPKVSPESLKALNQLYNLYDKHKDTFSKSPVSPLYCVSHSEATFLVNCDLSDHKDKDGRGIYCLQGISVASKYKRHFWFILPWILANYACEGLLNIWRKIDFPGADTIVRHSSKDYSFKLDQLGESLARLTQPPKSIAEKLSQNESSYISFDHNGLKELSHLLVSSHHDYMDFAFGATPEMAKNFNFKIIARVGSRSKIKKDAEATTGEITASFAAADRDKTSGEIPEDSIDRFNPRKKNELHQTKILRGTGPSHILSEFLPRFLSIFKIGRKLKQRFKSS